MQQLDDAQTMKKMWLEGFVFGELMKKSTSRTLTLIGIGIMLIGAVIIITGAVAATHTDAYYGQSTMSNGAPAGMAIWGPLGGLLAGVGNILMLIGLIGALVKTAQLQRWGWFVCLLLLGWGALLVYIFAGPETPAVAMQPQQPYYPQPGPYRPTNQPPYLPSGSYPPANQPFYPQGPYPPQQYDSNFRG